LGEGILQKAAVRCSGEYLSDGHVMNPLWHLKY